jgi:hypothetical protein
MSLLKTGYSEHESFGFGDEAYIGKIVFKAVRDAMNQEATKVGEELERQLGAIFGGLDSRDKGVTASLPTKCTPYDTYRKVRRDVKQLFLYLQRVLMLNVIQDLCERLTSVFIEPMKTVAQGNTETQKLENKIVDYEKRIREFSEKISEYETRLDKFGEDGYDMRDGFESLSRHIESLLELTHKVTDLLEYASRKFLEVREENGELNGDQAGSAD